MSIKPNTRANLGPRQPAQPAVEPAPRPARVSVADTFNRVSATQTKLTHRIDASLHRRFKLATTAAGVSMGDVLEELITDWLRENER